MAVRIYSLAKELKLDSKVLVDICTKAGVTGKGSALASLTDEEVDRVKAYLSPAAPASRRPKPPLAAEAGRDRRRRGTAASGRARRSCGAKITSRRPACGDKLPVARRSRRSDRPAEAAEEAGRRMRAKPPAKAGAGDQAGAAAASARSPPRRASRPSRLRKSPTSNCRPTPSAPASAGQQAAVRASAQARAKAQGRRRPTPPSRAVAPRRPAALADCRPAPPTKPAGRERAAAAPEPVAAKAKPATGDVDTSLGGREAASTQSASAPADAAAHRRRRRRRAGRPPRRRALIAANARGTNTAAPRKGKVTLQLPCTVRSFSEAVGVRAQQVLRQADGHGHHGQHQRRRIDPETVELLAVELGVEVDFKQRGRLCEEQLLGDARQAATIRPDARSRVRRSSRSWATSTTARRRCWTRSSASTWPAAKAAASRSTSAPTRSKRTAGKIAFVDTPGHEAFTEMRARGANVTDIAVLVVAADDGVMPQTEEAISHARAAGVPIVVALNKIDLPGVDVAAHLSAIGRQRVAADRMGRRHRSRQNQRHHRRRARRTAGNAAHHRRVARSTRPIPTGRPYGTCLEAEMHEGRGVVAKLIVQNGTLRVGDAIVCGTAFGRVKAMYDTLDRDITYRRGRAHRRRST